MRTSSAYRTRWELFDSSHTSLMFKFFSLELDLLAMSNKSEGSGNNTINLMQLYFD